MYSEAEIQQQELTHHAVTEWVDYEPHENGITFECTTDTDRGAEVWLDVLSDGVVRLRFVPAGIAPTPSAIPVSEPPDEPTVVIREDDDAVVLETDTVVCRIDRFPWNVSVTRTDGRMICKEATDDIDAHAYRRSLLPGYTTDYTGTVVGVDESFALGPTESFFGLGEKFTGLDKRGQTITIENKNPYGSGTEEAHKNVPFVLNSRGFGLFLDTTYRNVWELGSRSNAAYSLYSEDEYLDLYFIVSDSLTDVLDTYTDMTGKPPLPPKWSFGLNLWAFSPEGEFLLGQDRVTDLAERVREAGLPADMMFLTTSSWNDLLTEGYDLTFDEDRFPNPEEFKQSLETHDFKLIGSIMPFLPVESSMFAHAHENGYLLSEPDGSPIIEPVFHESHLPMVRTAKREGAIETDRTTPWREIVTERFEGDEATGALEDLTRSEKWRWKGKDDYYGPGGFVDFTNPDAVEWWQEKVAHALSVEGFDGFMTDFAEETPHDAVYHDGSTGRELYNFYSTLYQEANYGAFELADKQPFVRARSGYAGLGQYPTCWPGDPNPTFEAMYSILRGGLNLGVSGIPFWMSYIGAHTGKPTDELFVRWSQWAMFASHTDPGPNNPLSFREEIRDIYLKYAKLRYRLLPYVYSYGYQATETGVPVMRPLFIEYEDDSRSYEIETEYLLGEELLVAPILEESTDGSGTVERDVYLPPDDWVDYWDGTVYEGGTTVTYSASLEDLPLFVRQDAIVPMIQETTHIGERRFDPVILDVHVATRASFTLYDEELVEIEARRTEEGMTIELSSSVKEYRLDLHDAEGVTDVSIDGDAVDEYESASAVPDGEPGWWERSDSGISVAFDSAGRAKEVTLSMD